MSITPLMPVYPRCGVRPVKGEHCHLIDEDGTRYLDFASGIAVNLLGHSHAGLIGAIQRQAETLPTMPSRGSEHFCVFDGRTGEEVSVAHMINVAAECEVVHLGECHDDPIAHSLEAYILVSLAARRDQCGLSLEMIERDAQTVRANRVTLDACARPPVP